MRRLADFENSGDLILNSTLYPDGSVAALEELIGNHGGLGGEQTDAYLFHPGDMVVPPTRSSYEFKAILDSRRGLPGTAPKPERPAVEEIDPWKPATVTKGLGMVGTWLSLAARSIALSKDAFREIARNPYLSAPALLISVLAQLLIVYFRQDKFSYLVDFLVSFAAWYVTLILLQVTLKLLRGKGSMQATFRVAGFARSAHILELFGLIPSLAPLALFLSNLLALVSLWIGMGVAHELRGLRTLLIPLIYLLVLVVSIVFLTSAVEGISLSLQYILAAFGLAP